MTINDFEHEKLPSGYRIKGYKGNEKHIAIPEGTVVITSNAFSGLKINSVSFPESLLYIHDGAFEDCGALTYVDFSKANKLEMIGASAFCNSGIVEVCLPESVKEIGYAAFSVCRSLMRVYIPGSVKKMDWDIFAGASSLKTITVGGTIPEAWGYRWNGSDAEAKIGKPFTPTVPFIEKKAVPEAPKADVEVKRNAPLQEAKKSAPEAKVKTEQKTENEAPISADNVSERDSSVREEITAPNVKNEYYTPMSSLEVKRTAAGLELVGIKDKNLKELILPPEITTIGGSAMLYGYKLQKFKATKTLRAIGYRAFNSCMSLSEIEFPYSVCLGEAVFHGCLGLGNAILTKSMEANVYSDTSVCTFSYDTGEFAPTELPDETFMKTNLYEVALPDSITSVGRYAFRDSFRLKSIKFGKGQDISIGEGAFSDCYNLESFEFLPGMLPDIPASCFNNCVSLKLIKFSKRPGTIGFFGLVGLKLDEITIPKNMTPMRGSIGSENLRRVILEGRTLYDLERLGTGFILPDEAKPWKIVDIVCTDGVFRHSADKRKR